jgi:hypothetical protein
LREMIARGEALWAQAVGYVRNEDNGVEMMVHPELPCADLTPTQVVVH